MTEGDVTNWPTAVVAVAVIALLAVIFWRSTR